MNPEDALRGLKTLTDRVAKDGVGRSLTATGAEQSRAVARRDELAADAGTPLYDHLMAMVQATAEENEYVAQAPDVAGTSRAADRKWRVQTVVHFVAGVIVAVAVGRAVFVWVTRPSQLPAVVAAADSPRSEERIPVTPVAPAEGAPTVAAPTVAAPTVAAPEQTAPTQAGPAETMPAEGTVAEVQPASAPPAQATPAEAGPAEAAPADAAPAAQFAPAAAPSSPAPIAVDGEQTTTAEADAAPVVAAASPVEPAPAAPDEPAETAQPADATAAPSTATEGSAIAAASLETAALAEPESAAPATNEASEPPSAEEPPRAEPPAIQTGSIERGADEADASPATRRAWIVSDVNMRAGPKKSEPVLVAIPKGRPVELIGCRTWCEVIYAGKRGWVYKNYIGDTPGPGRT